MKKLFYLFIFSATLGLATSCGDDDDDQVCTKCESSGNVVEMCGTEEDVKDTEDTFTSSGGTCTRQ